MMKPLTVTAAALILPTAMLSACASGESPTAKSSSSTTSTSTTAAPPPGVERLVAQLKRADGTVVANATLDFRNGVTTITVDTVGPKPLPPGFHGLHVHSVGKCEGDFSSAGGHFQKSGHTGHPASGDLTSLEVRSDGSATLVTTTDAFTPTDLLSGQKTALIIHEGPDNFGNIPSRYSTHGESGADQQTLDTGDSGARLACGVIDSVNAIPTSATTTTTTTFHRR